MKLLFCLRFPSLRRRKNPKKSVSSNPKVSKHTKPIPTVDKKTRLDITSRESIPTIDEKPKVSVPDAAPYLHVNSMRIQPMAACEYLHAVDTDRGNDSVYFVQRKNPEVPIIIGTTDEKKMLAADEVIRTLQGSNSHEISDEEFRNMVLEDNPKMVYLAVDRNDWEKRGGD
ncbi:hypothetical protein BDD12DRAFT_893153 [Trichophaea hybrida]|nr:hypothetical protein BDD12DRAFT_893153 [Trichophaea hybrida]